MDWVKKRFVLLKALFDALFNSPDTVDYPFSTLKLPNGFRGAITIDPEKCTGCGLCVRDCPAQGLKLVKESKNKFQLIHYPSRCAYCGQCEDNCRRGAISHSNKLIQPSTKSDQTPIILVDRTPSSSSKPTD